MTSFTTLSSGKRFKMFEVWIKTKLCTHGNTTNLRRVNENKDTRRVFKLSIAAHLLTTFCCHIGKRRAYVIFPRQNTKQLIIKNYRKIWSFISEMLVQFRLSISLIWKHFWYIVYQKKPQKHLRHEGDLNIWQSQGHRKYLSPYG